MALISPTRSPDSSQKIMGNIRQDYSPDIPLPLYKALSSMNSAVSNLAGTGGFLGSLDATTGDARTLKKHLELLTWGRVGKRTVIYL